MRRIAATLLVLGACAAALALSAAGGGGSSGKRSYRLVFDNAFGLVEGGDFRVAGVTVGRISGFDIRVSRSGVAKSVVRVEVDSSRGGALREDARCEVKPQSLVGEFLIDCEAGSSPRPLGDGATLPVQRTASAIPPDLVSNVLRRPQRERLRLIVTGLGMGLAGRAGDLEAVLRRSHPGLRETDEVLSILADQNRTIERFVTDADVAVGDLARARRQVVRFVRESRRTAETTASRREELKLALRRLPGFLRELSPSAARLRELADEQIPLLEDLRRGAPDLTRFLRRLPPFARAARPALRDLGGAAEVGTAALREGRREVDELRRLSSDAPPTAKPLRQLLESLDDRRRAIDPDPRARVDGPPPGDPSYAGGRGGFTGFEAIANYFFWQTLSINGFDHLGHVLRAGVTLTKCSPYRNAPPRSAEDRRLFADCNAWLGPRQPGINAPDPSEPPGAGPRSARGRAGARGGRRAGSPAPGAKVRPEQPPLRGRPDLSKPRPVLPPGVERLLDQLQSRAPAPRRPQAPAPRGTDGLLDFLLGP